MSNEFDAHFKDCIQFKALPIGATFKVNEKIYRKARIKTIRRHPYNAINTETNGRAAFGDKFPITHLVSLK